MSRLAGRKNADLTHSEDSKKVMRAVLNILKDQLKNYSSKRMIVQLNPLPRIIETQDARRRLQLINELKRVCLLADSFEREPRFLRAL